MIGYKKRLQKKLNSIDKKIDFLKTFVHFVGDNYPEVLIEFGRKYIKGEFENGNKNK